MKTKAALVVGVLVFAGTPLVASEVTQTTGSGSWCSPTQNGNGNTVICNGVDPRAVDRLNELLDRKDLDLKQKIAEANEWAHRYNELNAQLEETKKQLAVKGEDATLVQSAEDLLHEGKLEEARAIFDRLIPSDELNVDRAAQDHFGRASVFALQLRLDEALPDYAKAYQYRPDNQRYTAAYAEALLRQRDYPKAESVLRDLLRQWRSPATQEPDLRSDLAGALDNLGIVYRMTNRFAEAEAVDREAVDIERALAAQNPAANRHDLAATLNNLGNLDRKTNRIAEAETAYKEAADIERALAAQNPAAYRPELAMMLDNLGIVYRMTNRFAEAEAVDREAVDIERALAAQNPAAYRPALALTLNIQGLLYGETLRFAEAETALKEAVDIRRGLAAQNPAAYRPELADTLNNLGVLFAHTHRFAEAEAAFKEAADIRRELAAQNPAAYRPDLVAALTNLASLYRDMHRDGDAKAAEAEALAPANMR